MNGFGFVTGIWEVSVGHDEDLAWWLQAVRERWPDTQVMTEGAFGMEWRKTHAQQCATRLSFRCKRNRRARLGERA